MNTQEAYEVQRKWFIDTQAYGWDDVQQACAYRGDDGSKCAIGCILPDSLYNRNMEGQGAYALLVMKNFGKEIVEFFKGVESDYLMDSQSLHDSCADAGTPIEEFIGQLDELADKYGLEVPSGDN